MRLADLPGLLLADTLRKLRRRVIAGVVILIAAIIAVAECLSAARLALEPHVGPVGARLILAGAFLAVIAGTAYWVSRPTAAAGAAKDRLNSDERVTIIAEAISLGYSLARDLSRPSVSDPVPESPDPTVPPVTPTPAEPPRPSPL